MTQHHGREDDALMSLAIGLDLLEELVGICRMNVEAIARVREVEADAEAAYQQERADARDVLQRVREEDAS